MYQLLQVVMGGINVVIGAYLYSSVIEKGFLKSCLEICLEYGIIDKRIIS